MGGLLFKAVSKSGSEKLKYPGFSSLFEASAFNIDGRNTEIGSLCADKKCIMVVNVATK